MHGFDFVDGAPCSRNKAAGIFASAHQTQLLVLMEAVPFAKLLRREFKVRGDSADVGFGQADVTGHGAAIGAFRLTLKPEIKLPDLDELAHDAEQRKGWDGSKLVREYRRGSALPVSGLEDGPVRNRPAEHPPKPLN